MRGPVKCTRTLDRGNGKPILTCDRIASSHETHETADRVPFRESAVLAAESRTKP